MITVYWTEISKTNRDQMHKGCGLGHYYIMCLEHNHNDDDIYLRD